MFSVSLATDTHNKSRFREPSKIYIFHPLYQLNFKIENFSKKNISLNNAGSKMSDPKIERFQCLRKQKRILSAAKKQRLNKKSIKFYCLECVSFGGVDSIHFSFDGS